jgi:hypothetical protein
MRCSWLALAALFALPFQAKGDGPPKKYQVVSPRDDGIIGVAINGKGDVVGFHWVENKRFGGVIDQAAFFARGKEITYLPNLPGYTAIFPSAVSDDGLVVGRVGKAPPAGRIIPLRNQAFVWDREHGMRGLGVYQGDMSSVATDITHDGRRISGISVGDNHIRACVWDRSGEGWKITPLLQKAALGPNVVLLSDDGKYAASVDGDRPCLWKGSLRASGS